MKSLFDCSAVGTKSKEGEERLRFLDRPALLTAAASSGRIRLHCMRSLDDGDCVYFISFFFISKVG